ncbi:MAG: FliM/FliN family flagellar motor switch protein [Candidatus Latescibacterota bacterium]|jgi:flagellar motor switch protein FliN/FliY
MATNKERERLAHLGSARLQVSCELGRKQISLREVNQLKEQDVIEFDKLAGEAFEIRLNGHHFAHGEVVVVTDKMAVRVTSLVEVEEVDS